MEVGRQFRPESGVTGVLPTIGNQSNAHAPVCAQREPDASPKKPLVGQGSQSMNLHFECPLRP
jgi:hypothetical protein